MLQCGHLIHDACLKDKIFSDLYKKDKVNCNQCQAEITMAYITRSINKEDMDRLSDELLKIKYLEKMVGCPKCKERFLFEHGNFVNKKDAKGSAVSREAAECKNKYKFNCPSCESISCINCNAIPYHDLKTCKQFGENRLKVKCIFCKEDILKVSVLEKDKNFATCSKPECLNLKEIRCTKKLKCGHYCLGCKKSKKHLPCLHEDCVNANSSATNGVTRGDYCSICFVEALEDKPTTMLSCKHFFHDKCLKEKIINKWVSPKISFEYLNCSLCNTSIHLDNPELKSIIDEDRKIEAEVLEISLKEAKKEGLDKHDYSGPPFNGNFETYAMYQVVVYQCYECKKYYPAGMKDCRREEQKKEELICRECTFLIECATQGATQGVDCCDIHGKGAIVYKCNFCCSVATFFCWGSTYFCNHCNNLQNQCKFLDLKPPEYFQQCSGRKFCPLKIDHPLHGTTKYAIWCAICKIETES